MEKADIWALFDHPTVNTFWKGRVCLLGDAAHASTPHQGAGAGMALEDAYVLSNLIGEMGVEDTFEAVFAAYDRARHARSTTVVTTSRQAGEIYHFRSRGIGDDLGKIDDNLKVRWKWIWDANVEDMLKEARGYFDNTQE